MGVYRMWRDSGYAVGAVLIGLSREFVNTAAAFYVTVGLLFASGAVVYVWMEETHLEFGTHESPAPARVGMGKGVRKAEDSVTARARGLHRQSENWLKLPTLSDLGTLMASLSDCSGRRNEEYVPRRLCDNLL